MDEEKKQYQVIRQDLIRSVITEPLLTEIQEPGDGLMDVIIDVNLQYQGGREQAFQAVREIAVEALAAIGQAGAEGRCKGPMLTYRIHCRQQVASSIGLHNISSSPGFQG